ncbi:ABC transporter substrate-binding protein [Bradyrhizobium mercantei]|uniref:ABC transporter substrate-binding protein n=1 Tax=Bradyrhizobium mercantei TaxID=1904807 RepID=UPI001177B596|nr:ABC transporter substrate-binding protein [Bradyrhizobium mercantei]
MTIQTVFARCALAAATLLIATATPARSADTLKVVVISQSDALALYVAADQHMFDKRGLSVEITPVANQSVVVSSLVSEAADIGFAVPPVIIQAKDNGIDLQIVCGATEFPLPKPAYAGILARTGSEIRSANDLIGKKVGVIGLNSFHHIMARRWLAENHVDPGKVEFVEVGLPQMQDLMKAGQIDAGVTVDPFYNRMIDQGVGYSFGDYLQTVPNGIPVDFYVAPKSWLANHQEIAVKFRDAIAEAIGHIKANEADARASLAKWTKLPAAVVASARIPNLSAGVDEGTLNWWVDLVKSQGLISGTVKAQDFTFRAQR